MILLFLLALQSAPAAAAPDDQEIVVLAQKLRRIDVAMKLRKKDGKAVLQRCALTRASGEAELDAIPCDVARLCMADGVTSRRQLEACVEQRSEKRIDAIIAARRLQAGRGAAGRH
ncbi:hypothetical protein [Sphingomonas parva]|uniref:hypothetical protein n=1 Tax=Sphingomonas parva TaxID=2555898 RepID=UPI0014301209|nr:hypothetical protein [Sphingomonas parva]